MATLLRAIIRFAWALWFGGLVTLFLVVTTLIHVFDAQRDLFAASAGAVFHRFEHYQLLLATVILTATLLCRAGGRTFFLILLLLTTAAALTETFAVAPRILALRAQGLVHTPQFHRAHGFSMLLYFSQTILLFLAGFVLPKAPRGEAPPALRPVP